MTARRPVTLQGWIAAGLLAILTVFVFATVRDQGPANSVRRFHEAVVKENALALSRVAVESLSNFELQIVLGHLQELLESGARQAQSPPVVRRRGAVAAVWVLYDYPDGRKNALLWIVRQTRGGAWKVDASETLRARRAVMGF